MSLAAHAEGLRLFNPTDVSIDADVVCEGASFARVVQPHAVDDVDGVACTAKAAAPLLVFETGVAEDGVEWQRAIGPTADGCPSTIPLLVPRSACRFGTVVVAVDAIEGASYSWSIDGGTFASGVGTDRVVINVGGADTLKVDVLVATPGCTRSGSGVVAVHDAFLIAGITAGTGFLGSTRTITWSYANGTPTEQILSGTDIAPVVLPNDARSYSYVPLTEGDKSVTIQARSGPMPVDGRRRAAGRGTAAASDCNVARASAAYHVNCATPVPIIIAPNTTNITSPFIARVDLDPPSTATWKIVNGSPASATGESVVVTPLASAPIDITVTVASGGCSASSTKRVAVDGTFACDNPTVDVAILQNDCSGSVVQARFTGKPPYSGTWNDGVKFITSDRAIQRPVLAAGTFSVVSFSDAICAGQKSNSVTVTPRIATATLTAPGGMCAGGNATVTATFTGTPPFAGTWYDGTTFSTTSNQITKIVPHGGPVYMDFHDAVCPTKTSQTIVLIEPATVQVSLDRSSPVSCTNYAILDVDIAGGAPPFSLTWSDGYTQNTSPSPANHFTRTVSVAAPSSTYGVVAARDAFCALRLSPPVTITGKSSASFYQGQQTFCAGQTGTASLNSTPPAGSTIAWTITNGTITSGQETTSVKYIGNPGVTGSLSCQVTNSAGCTDTAAANFVFYGTPAPPQLSITPSSTVQLGATVTIAWTVDNNTASTTIVASTPDNQPTPANCFAKVCSATYTTRHTGQILLTVHANPRCGTTVVDGTATLTVNP